MEPIAFDFFEFYDSEMNSKAFELAQRLFAKYGNYELGRNRLVFFSKFSVIKIPTANDGCADNDWEGSVCGGIARSREWESQEDANYPNTKLLEIDGLVCVMMERVEPVHFDNYNKVPDWVKGIDGGQVGFTKKGKLVAYDYGVR